ncbi:hypothetical protein AgCh_013179 [Apium graveolens]
MDGATVRRRLNSTFDLNYKCGYRCGSQAFHVDEVWWERRYESLDASKRWQRNFQNWDMKNARRYGGKITQSVLLMPKEPNKSQKDIVEDQAIQEFIKSHIEWVDVIIAKEALQGVDHSITGALDQIHNMTLARCRKPSRRDYKGALLRFKGKEIHQHKTRKNDKKISYHGEGKANSNWVEIHKGKGDTRMEEHHNPQKDQSDRTRNHVGSTTENNKSDSRTIHLDINENFKELLQRSTVVMSKKDIGVKIPVLERDNYHHWKVKMHLHLLSQDESYINCIENGPHIPHKVATVATSRVAVGQSIPKP